MLEGRSGTLVVRGEAGIGKSALLEYAAAKAPGRVLRVTGVESEADLPFAALHLLVELSAAGPVVCLVDDAQWLDGESADALLFAARRVHAEPVTVLFAAREGEFPARGLPELWLGALDAESAQRLLAAHAANLPPAVHEQLVAEAGGNPLALVELPRMLSAEQRRGALAPLSFSLGTAGSDLPPPAGAYRGAARL